jgi:integrase
MHQLHQSGELAPRAIVTGKANTRLPLRGDFSAMAKRRFQDPKPFCEGKWWWIFAWQDEFREGRLERRRKRIKICPVGMPDREARRMATELLRPMNQGLQTIASATGFADYVDDTYKPTVLPGFASTTRSCYEGTINKYLMPQFGDIPLREMTTLHLQRYFASLGTSALGGATILKIKEVLSSILGSAVRFDLLIKNPLLTVQIPRSKVVNHKRQKPHITPEEFQRLLAIVAEPYATMVFVAAFTGLRVSELIGLKWEDVREESLTVDERYCRGDWSVTKTPGSSTTIGVADAVIARIRRLKTLEVEINWGGQGARKRIKLVRSDQSQDLIFQSVNAGRPMSDGNVLRRHLRPAAIKLNIDPKKVTWRSLRTSCATWMVEAGANPKDVQGQMRHSRISTTMDIYAQHVPSSQRVAVAKMMDMVESRCPQPVTIN